MSFGVVDGFADQVKKIFKKDTHSIDNFLFSLHHKYSFIIILVGIIFISSNNYLNSDNITCLGTTDYAKEYCFLHGASHVPISLQGNVSSTDCTTKEESETPGRVTSYYIWLPVVLSICAIITKLPRVLWKQVLEREMIKKFVTDLSTGKDDAAEKMSERFFKVAETWQALAYNLSFAFCELLNFVAIFVNWAILNLLLNKEFWNYGTKTRNWWNNPDLHKDNPDLTHVNPMCHLFPTEVSCTVRMGAVTGGTDLKNTLCILPFNVFNQYFFLVLWWWWEILIVISCFGLLYRVLQIGVGGVGMFRLRTIMGMLGVDSRNQDKVEALQLRPWQIFLLNRLALCLKGSELNALLAVPRTGNKGKMEGDGSVYKV